MALVLTQPATHGTSTLMSDHKIIQDIPDYIPEAESSVPPYTQPRDIQPGTMDRTDAVFAVPERSPIVSSNDCQGLQASPSSSNYAGSRPSTESSPTTPVASTDKGMNIEEGQKHSSLGFKTEKLQPQNIDSEKRFEGLPQHLTNGSYVNGYSDPYPTSIHTSEIGTPSSVVTSTESNRSSANPSVDAEHKQIGVDLESGQSIKHNARLYEMGHHSIFQICVLGASIAIGFAALVVTVAILGSHRSKKMAHGGFTGGITALFFSVAAGMWACERTMVEVLIAMNMVVVYGIFLSSQVDVFMSYSTS